MGDSRDDERRRLEAAAGKPESPAADLTWRGLVAAFLRHAETRYAPRHGESNNELMNCRRAFAPLLHYYGDQRVAQSTPFLLRALQIHWSERGMCAPTINGLMGRIRRLTKWGAARGLIAWELLKPLAVVEPARPGQDGVPASEPLRLPTRVDIEATMPFLRPPLRVAVQFMLHTAARVGECAGLRLDDIDMSEEVWIVRLRRHKNAHRQQERILYVGPSIQRLLMPLLRPGLPVFATRFGSAYRAATLSQEIRRGVQRALAACAIGRPWPAGALRHVAATQVAARDSIHTARYVLGHRSLATTERYVHNGENECKEYYKRLALEHAQMELFA